MLKYFVLFIVLYIVYKLVFSVLIPVLRVSKQMRQQFHEIQKNGHKHAGANSNLSPKNTATPPTKFTKKNDKDGGDYIDFEEVK